MAIPQTIKPTQARSIIARLRQEPETFAREVLGASPYDKQVAILDMARDARRVAVVGANATGKDWTVGGILIPWWITTRSPAMAIVLAPTYRQVNHIVWRELRLSFERSKVPLGGEMYDTPLWRVATDHLALGFSTDRPWNIQGFHSPNLLVVVSEAHAMGQGYMEAVKRLNPSLIVMTGNPFTVAGEFYDAFHGASGLWQCLSLSAFDTPNLKEGRQAIPGLVTLEDVEERRREWGEGSPLYVASILGEFPDSLDDAVVPLRFVMQAVDADLPPAEPNVVAVDVARFGEDKTVVLHRRGPHCRIVWKARGKDTTEVTNWVAHYVAEWGRNDENAAKADARKPSPIRYVVVDDVGVGGGVTDQLKRRGLPIVAFQGGASSSKPNADRYANSTTEAWMLMGQAFRNGQLDIERDDSLISQLSTRLYKIQSDRRIKIQSKEDMRPQDRSFRTAWTSPDEADALSMSFTGHLPFREFKIWV